jgi:hypothetical protein
MPAGRTVEGAAASVQLHPARLVHGRLMVDISDAGRWRQFSRSPGRGLLIGVNPAAEGPRFYAADTHGIRWAAGKHRAVALPDAYELDDLTFGILWATASLDDGLQVDDHELSISRGELAAYESLVSSAVSREAVPGLTAVSQMWLGSDFCARHILRRVDELPSQPVFWTREQHGEEASTWLLFDHKFTYLRRLKERAAGARLTRTFCIPESVVADSPQHERILLFLAAALMESCDIEVRLTSDPAYADVDGFVLAGRRAIVANWVRSDGMWRVDTTDRRSTIAEYVDVTGDVGTHSRIEAATSAGRLQALAGYLNLDFAWLRGRCGALGRHGAAGLARPRSRLVSTAGVDAACSYLGSLPIAS